MPRALWWPEGLGLFLMSEVPRDWREMVMPNGFTGELSPFKGSTRGPAKNEHAEASPYPRGYVTWGGVL